MDMAKEVQRATEEQQSAYRQFTKQNYGSQLHNKEWEYAYCVKDENLKNDIHNARKSAEEYVKAFMSSLKADAKSAVKGASEGALPYIIGGFILLVFIPFAQMCS
mgnify:CR=1 FL=1